MRILPLHLPAEYVAVSCLGPDRNELQALTEKLAAAGGGEHRSLSSMELEVAMSALGADGGGAEIDFNSFWRWWGRGSGGDGDDELRHQLRAAKMAWAAQSRRVKLVVQVFFAWRSRYHFKVRCRLILLNQYVVNMQRRQARSFVAWATVAAYRQQARFQAANAGIPYTSDDADSRPSSNGEEQAGAGVGGGEQWAGLAHAVAPDAAAAAVAAAAEEEPSVEHEHSYE